MNSGALLFQDTKEVGVNEQPGLTCLSFLGLSSPQQQSPDKSSET